VNFLAHLFLAGPEPDLIVGNFIGDFVRGRGWQRQCGPDVVRGVLLHRAIDTFTDRHPIVKQSQSRLRLKYRHYAKVIVDVYYDHYLAARWSEYAGEPLTSFAERAYRLLADRDAMLPERARGIVPHMRAGNWLVQYAQLEGIARALGGLSQRAMPGSRMHEAIDDLRAHYPAFGTEFQMFFPDLQAFADAWRQTPADPLSPKRVVGRMSPV